MKKENSYDSFNKARDLAFDSAIKNLKDASKIKHYEDMDRSSWNEEVGSFTMLTPRQTGESMWICNKAIELVKGGDVVILSEKEDYREALVKKLLNIIEVKKIKMNSFNTRCMTFKGNNIHISDFKLSNLNYSDWTKANYIFIDSSEFMKKSDKDFILKHSKAKLIIWM